MRAGTLRIILALAGLFAPLSHAVAAAPAYHADVKPIIDARCAGCHRNGDIAPWPLTTYDEVLARKDLVTSAVRSRKMPPWHASRQCGDYVNDRSLTDAQISTILQWSAADGPEGDPAAPGPVLPPVTGGLSRADVTLAMPEAYEPRIVPDDYRCMVLDWPRGESAYLTGINILPGNRSIVHHVIVYLVEPQDAAKAERLDAADPGPGYTCFGDSRIDDAQWVGVWGPGTSGMDFPAGTGVPVKPGSKIVLQMHYHGHGGADHHGAPAEQRSFADRSSVQFKVDRSVEKRAHLLTYFDPTWFDQPRSMLIPAGQREVRHAFKTDLARLYADGRALEVYGVWHHMHLLGKSGRIAVQRGGSEDCLLDIPEWDFHWQTVYWLKQPKRIEAGDRLELACTFDNSAEHQPVIGGTRRTPHDVTWGEGSDDEMCVAALYLTVEGERP